MLSKELQIFTSSKILGEKREELHYIKKQPRLVIPLRTQIHNRVEHAQDILFALVSPETTPWPIQIPVKQGGSWRKQMEQVSLLAPTNLLHRAYVQYKQNSEPSSCSLAQQRDLPRLANRLAVPILVTASSSHLNLLWPCHQTQTPLIGLRAPSLHWTPSHCS